MDKRLEEFLDNMERIRLDEYVRYVSDHRRVLRVSFLSGVAKGLGAAVGFTLLGGMLVFFLQQLISRNIPVIGDFLAQMMRIIKYRS